MGRSLVAIVALLLTAELPLPSAHGPDPHRASVIARAKVWHPTDVAAMDLKAGPSAPKALAFDETIACTYVKEKFSGKTPKFACDTDDGDHLKVKFGGDNGEVYAEVMATRLLWALGFGADHMYSVRVVCRGCPSSFNGVIRSAHESVFGPAAVERKMPGEAFKPDEGWSWKELDLVDEKAGGATRAEIDALRLMAVFMQHTDTKPEQQRLICLGESKEDRQGQGPMPCAQPFMMINDLGVTFGKANKFNEGAPGSANLVNWSKTPIWRDDASCVGNLPKSATGTLDNPTISEEGRALVADLLSRLTDDQLHDLFEAARVTLRVRDPKDATSGFATIDDWVAAFKEKRSQIVDRHCSTS